jgi:hypothetical protein
MSEVDADEPHSAAVEPQSYSDEEHAINVVKASEGSSSKPFIAQERWRLEVWCFILSWALLILSDSNFILLGLVL